MPVVIKFKNCGNEKVTSPSKAGDFCSKGCATSYRQRIDDPNFFGQDNDFDWYIIGLIFGDGCLSQSKGRQETITLTLKDKEFMERLRQIVCPKRKLYVCKARKETHSETYSIITANKEVIDRFKQLGLTPRKSTTIQLPCVENERAFVRGYFDANGSIFKNTVNGHSYYHVSITTGNREFAYQLREMIEHNGFSPTVIKDSRDNHNAWYVKLYRKKEIPSFGRWIYKDTNWYLPRKFNLFQMI